MPPLGSIPLAGLTLLAAHRRVVERARAVFRFVEVPVAGVAPRTFEVPVSGEVERPGTLVATATRRLHDLILEAGGITARGSVRRVVVTRQGLQSLAVVGYPAAMMVDQQPAGLEDIHRLGVV